MTLYGTALWLHIVFAILLVGGTAWLHVAISLAKRSGTVETARAHIAYIAAVGKLTPPAAVLTLLPALYLAFAGDWWGAGWPIVALGLFLVAGATAGGFIDPTVKAIKAAADEAPDGPLTAELRAALVNPKLTMMTWVLAGIDLSIVFLMTNKPGYLGSIAAGLIGIAGGAAIAVRENRHAVAPPAPAAEAPA